jgi:hypothetical protein
MNSQEVKSLTAADLALYIGQPFRVYATVSGVGWYERTGDSLTPSDLATYNVKYVKPILRPLSDLTEEEARECFALWSGGRFNPDDYYNASALEDWWRYADDHDVDARAYCIGTPAVWRYLLSRGFDLFNWIPDGLAIDKTTL